MPDAARGALIDAALRLGRAVKYQSAGTVEFIYDNDTGDWYFLEVNTRLQVEHGVTEEVTGIDLVEWMVRQAAGEMPPLHTAPIRPRGCSLQVRLYAEDPAKEFQPSAGHLSSVAWPAGVRVETWVESGTEITPYYDPMLAKIIVHGENRESALGRMRAALAECRIAGIETNLEYLRQVTADRGIRSGRHHDVLPARIRVSPPCSGRARRAACRPPCRIFRDGSVTGMSACRLPVRWMTWHSAPRISWWEMTNGRRAWRSP